MAAMGVYDQIKKAFQDVIAPELHELRGEIRRLDQRVESVDHKIDGVDARMGARLDALHDKIDGVDARMGVRLGALDGKIDGVDERLGVRLQSLDDKIDSLRVESRAMKGELLAEIRRLDVRVDGVDRDIRTAIDVRERLAALEARRGP